MSAMPDAPVHPEVDDVVGANGYRARATVKGRLR